MSAVRRRSICYLLNYVRIADLYDLHFESVLLPEKFDGSQEAIVAAEGRPGSLRLVEWKRLETDVYVTSSRTVFFSPKARKRNRRLEIYKYAFNKRYFTAVKKLVPVIREWILAASALRSTAAAMSTAATVERDAAGRRRVPPSKAFDISLSVAVPNPDKIKVLWEPKTALERNRFALSIKFDNVFISPPLYYFQNTFNPSSTN